MVASEYESGAQRTCSDPVDKKAFRLDAGQIADPRGMAARFKSTLGANVGANLACSVGIAANQQLDKMACKMDKPNGVTIWNPPDMPEPLFAVRVEDILGSPPIARVKTH